MNNLVTVEEVREVIDSANFYVNAQYNESRVKEDALRHAEDTGEDGILNVTDEEIKSTIESSKDLWDDSYSKKMQIESVLTYIADRYDDNGGHETITPVVTLKGIRFTDEL